MNNSKLQIYDTKYRQEQNGQIGITLNSDWSEPESIEHKNAAALNMDFMLGFWAKLKGVHKVIQKLNSLDTLFKPIFVDGKYPEQLVNAVQQAGDAHTDVLTFTEDESKDILGSSDFFGLNHYYSMITTACEECKYGFDSFSCPNWPQAGPYWLKSVPWGLRRLLNHIHDKYNSEKVYVWGVSVPEIPSSISNQTFKYFLSFRFISLRTVSPRLKETLLMEPIMSQI